jgi:hypothetical protein
MVQARRLALIDQQCCLLGLSLDRAGVGAEKTIDRGVGQSIQSHVGAPSSSSGIGRRESPAIAVAPPAEGEGVCSQCEPEPIAITKSKEL